APRALVTPVHVGGERVAREREVLLGVAQGVGHLLHLGRARLDRRGRVPEVLAEELQLTDALVERRHDVTMPWDCSSSRTTPSRPFTTFSVSPSTAVLPDCRTASVGSVTCWNACSASRSLSKAGPR